MKETPDGSKTSEFYNDFHKEKNNREDSYGMTIVEMATANLDFHTVLDAGCGQGAVVRDFLKNGYDAVGIDISDWAVNAQNQKLADQGRMFVGSLDQLPFPDNSFDLVFSSDVLEHIPENRIPTVASEIVRVCKKHIFLSISLRPSSQNNKFHITLKPREWWEQQFLVAGAVKNDELRNKLQKLAAGASVEEIIRQGPARFIADEMQWFFDEPPYDFNGELEPWLFTFTVSEK